MTHVKTKIDKDRLIEYYLERILEEFKPNRVYLTGSATSQSMPENSDFDFIVDSEIPIDADAIIGNLDIIPIKYATEEMLKKAKLLYSSDFEPA